MTVLEIVTAKVNNDLIPTIDIQMAIDEVEQVILNYCNLKTIPDALNYTWANMAVELLQYQTEVKAKQEEGSSLLENADVELSEIKSITQGDTQIILGNTSSINNRAKALNSHAANLDTLVFNHKQQLQKFRRLVW